MLSQFGGVNLSKFRRTRQGDIPFLKHKSTQRSTSRAFLFNLILLPAQPTLVVGGARHGRALLRELSDALGDEELPQELRDLALPDVLEFDLGDPGGATSVS